MSNPTPQTQEDLEVIYSKYQLLPVLREQFAEAVEDLPEGDWKSFLIDVMVQISLHRQADPETMVGVLYPKHGEPQEIADKLMTAAEQDYIDFDPVSQKFMVVFDVTEDVQNLLDRYQYPLPMVIPPNPVKTNKDTGYLTIKNPVILNGSPYFKDKDVCLDHLNRANSVALSLNPKIIKSEQGKFIAPKRKPDEDFGDFRKRVKQANTFYDTSMSVMEELLSISDTLWLTHRYDRRGRCYASGYHVNTQGMDYNKAVIELAKKEVIK